MTYTFSSDGVASYFAELYSGTDEDLLNEAAVVSADFSVWLTGTFNLSVYQAEYLDGVPEKILVLWGHLYAAAIISRGDVTIVDPIPNLTRRTKETEKNVKARLLYNNSDKILEGSIDIAVDWELLGP